MERPIKVWSLLLVLIPLAAAKQGFLFTSPKSLTSEVNETLYLTLYDVPNGGLVTVSLQQSDANGTRTLAFGTQVVHEPSPAGGQLVRLVLTVPKMKPYTQVTLVVEGAFGPYTFKNQTEVTVYTRSDTTFVQTDKPIYKPGQLVRFRVLPVDSELRPIGEAAKADIWVENPSGIRLAQWLDVNFKKGMEQFEMQLSEQPNLGQWTINVNITSRKPKYDGQLTMENFQVEEYVLPKFEVIVTPPPFVLANSENITWKICGRYTYGKEVKGNYSATVTFERYGSWDNNIYPTIRHEAKLDGCATYTVYLKDLNWTNYTYRYRPMKLFATVSETGTDVEQNGTASVSLTTNPAQLSFTHPDYNNRFFKPGMPFYGQLSVSNPDNTPRPDEKIQLCAMPTTEQTGPYLHTTGTELTCKNLTSDAKGIVHFTVPPRSGNLVNIRIQADAVNFPTRNYADNVVMIYQPSNTLQLGPWFSNSNRYVQIIPVTQTLACGEKHDFTVFLNGADGDIMNIYSQVMARGGIVSEQMTEYEFSKIKSSLATDDTYITSANSADTAPITLGKVTVTVTADYEMAPKGYLLVHYTRPDGEIIADSVDFDISKCLKNKVQMEFLSPRELPGTNVGVRVTASPNSLCGIGAVDKSIYLLNSGNLLTMDKVFDVLSSSSSNRFGYSYYPNNCVPQKVPGSSSFTRKRRSIVSPPYRVSSNYADSLNAFQNGNFLVLTDLTLVTKPCSPGSSPGPIRPYYSVGYGGSANKIGSAGVANEVSDMAAAPAAGFGGGGGGGFKPVVEVRNFFPETWLWEIDSTDDNGELLMKRELPHTITEWIGSAVCLHPQAGLGVSPSANVTAFQPFFVSATLPYSVIRGETLPVIMSVFNYLKECLAITLKMDPSENFTLASNSLEQTLCVCGGESQTYKYLVKPSKLGQLNFTVRAYTSTDKTVCGNKVVGDVTARDAATSSLLVEAEGFKRQEAFSTFFCPSRSNGTFKTTYTLAVPENTVADSARAEVLVTGDLMGPALRNIDNLVQMPTGCGEQNMLNFVPDIFILDYLTNTGKLSSDTEKKLLEYLKIGYQRELTYRHVDGSYSAFGQSDQVGSIWLSAFVVKAYAGASKYIFVDKSDISRTVQWIEANQDAQGCFPQIGEIHHTAMQGGSASNLGSKATMTSYVLISLLEGQVSNSSTVTRAQACLAQETNPTTYTLALMTYAACLSKDASASKHMDDLMKLKKTKGEFDYWEDDSTKSASIQIEIASYAILSLLTCGGAGSVEKALPIVRWVSQRRNTNGGFISTQDTVMGLQALARYATNIDKDSVDINVVVEAEGIGKTTYGVAESNKLLLQSTKLPTLPTPVDVVATGAGCALIQANLFYNVLAPPGFQAFHYNMSTLRGVGGSCKKAEITACMSFEFEDRFSNMALLELRLPSGYNVDTSSLELLKNDNQLFFKRYDVDGNKVALYFSKVGPTKKCYSIRLDQTFEVENLKPGTATLFDYYQPENQVSQTYTIDEQCP